MGRKPKPKFAPFETLSPLETKMLHMKLTGALQSEYNAREILILQEAIKKLVNAGRIKVQPKENDGYGKKSDN